MSDRQQTTLPLHTTSGQQASRSGGPSSTAQGKDLDAATTAAAATTSWTPNLERRQSWSAQDRKHELQMAAVNHEPTGPGFSERSE
ncbi:hypothetical protein V2A60_009168 [Cordyceps javanica]|uniref:Uncharacterized protein n=1 Tax=Cordyceps javanica TaxID=43265 RepID=A0A545UTA3_9HYPO|nr:hypothetical protein IF1G_08626 [Cordyceps javanica]TQW03337.1 hypothetical protein IF2G_09066 [Cordyceps javanica]